MKSFTYTIKDKTGIHARPAGQISRLSKEFESVVTIKKDDKEINAAKLMMLMSLGIKCGDTVVVSAEGTDEEKAIQLLEAFFNENL